MSVKNSKPDKYKTPCLDVLPVTKNFHPSVFESPVPEAKILSKIKNQDKLFNRTPESLELERSDLYSPADKFKDVPLTKLSKCRKTNYCSSYGKTIEKDIVSSLFFSKSNIDEIQRGLRYTVHKNSGFVIGNQSQEELFIVMRSVYLQYGRFPVIEDKVKQKNVIKQEIARLNEIVINEVVPNIVSYTQQYIQYLKDIDKVAEPLEMAKNDSIKGTKLFRDISDIFGA